MRRVAVAVLLLAAALSGCTEVEEKESAGGYEPSQLVDVSGTDSKRVTFTPEGARRVGLRQAAVARRGKHTVVPYDALVYEPDGKTYVYVARSALSFQREQVKVDRIEGERALVSSGPAAGTRVVTVGATEVYGTELEIEAG
jgi:hypothetical protein